MKWAFTAMVWMALGSSAFAWEPFRSTNSDVERGNERLRANDANGALQAYDRAAQSLPGDAGVQLNRGLALLAAGDLAQAREALLRATDPRGDRDVRADAYYDLGLAFYREGDTFATQEDHPQAQAQFREAVDAFRRSLRLRPGDRQTAWNLELALRRIREEQERQEQQEQEQQEQQEQQDQQQQDQQQQDQQDQQPQDTEDDGNGQRLPGHVERVLDALQDDEQSLERVRARARAARERRQPSRDW